MQKVNCFVIYFEFQRTKKYVASLSRRWDKKFLPTYTENIGMAKLFNDKQHATLTIENIHNVHNRTFLTEQVTVKQSDSKKYIREQVIQ